MLKITDTQENENDNEILLQLLNWETLEKVELVVAFLWGKNRKGHVGTGKWPSRRQAWEEKPRWRHR